MSAEILIIDDNSPDGTYKIIEKLKLKYKNLFLLKRKKKLGLGSAIREGMNYALKKKYNALITLDADLSHNPKEIPLFIKKSNMKVSSMVKQTPQSNGMSNNSCKPIAIPSTSAKSVAAIAISAKK